MNTVGAWIKRRLRISAVLLILGLMIEAASLRWSHPTAFLVFVIVGGSFVVAGILVYLYSLLRVGASSV